ncbi:site-specific integrase [Dyadobacter fanqingshengii]|uniref:Site-specific integrase n=1 Tax=Dyadobacter fanqingshengii TaxID=2906443 RepID=A0A9X1PCW1_9BACT|nr:site-specific integrase [Dyadobacter fanqingshengii]MCF0041608.1 site-specific integrase [Dyadobacter fanqingshengii]USJ36675.1 site-specific integrase [Dyadobacter fanqingshengii]
MLSKTFNLLFYLKKPKNYLNGKMPIYLRVTTDGSRFELAAKRDCEPEKWNSVSGRVAGTKQDVRSLNAYLDSLQTKVYEAHRTLIDSGKEVTAESIKNLLLGINDHPKMILEVFREHNNEMHALIEKDFARSTYNRYEAALRNVEEFLLFKYKVLDVSLDKLDYGLISAYAFYLKGKRNISHNTTMRYLVYFKKIVLLCVKNGWVPRDPFIFCCYTGLSYVDVQKLKRSEVIDGFDGKKWISIKRQKTDTPSKIPLLPVA